MNKIEQLVRDYTAETNTANKTKIHTEITTLLKLMDTEITQLKGQIDEATRILDELCKQRTVLLNTINPKHAERKFLNIDVIMSMDVPSKWMYPYEYTKMTVTFGGTATYRFKLHSIPVEHIHIENEQYTYIDIYACVGTPKKLTYKLIPQLSIKRPHSDKIAIVRGELYETTDIRDKN